MTEATDFAYAGARMQARHGARPDTAGWNQLARTGDLGALLQALGGTSLAPWVAEFTATTGIHRIERGLREHFRHEVDALARWLPRDWREAAVWVRWLPDLTALAHVRQQRRQWPWMAEDAIFRAAIDGDGPERSPTAELPGAGERATPTVIEGWWQGWRARQPDHRGRAAKEMPQAEALLRSLIEREQPWRDRQGTLEVGARRLFRRQTRGPAGAFAYLVLLYLQFIRLRGLLLQRRLFPPSGRAG